MSGTVQIEPFNAEFLTREKLHDLIFDRKSFDITNVNDISETVHNLATWNPDYEIGKNYVKRTLSVRYKK